jgi:ArsR family transcriptional regulator
MKSPAPASIFAAFADPTRLRLLNLLSGPAELCVCELMELLDAPQSTVSRHLSVLKRAGLVVSRARGKWEYYALASPEAALPKRLLSCVASCLAELPEMKADLAKLGRRAKANCA